MYNLQSDKEKYFLLGKIIKTHSYTGELVIHLDTDDPESYEGIKYLFINMQQSLVPWFISKLNMKGDLATIKLDDLDDLEKARELVGMEIYLPITELGPLEGKAFYFHEVIGFKVIDENHGDIGYVEEVLERPEQKLLRMLKDKREILVPLTEEMISRVDKEAKILFLDTPDGLIDLYLE